MADLRNDLGSFKNLTESQKGTQRYYKLVPPIQGSLRNEMFTRKCLLINYYYPKYALTLILLNYCSLRSSSDLLFFCLTSLSLAILDTPQNMLRKKAEH